MKFYSLYLLLIIALIGLSVIAANLCEQHPLYLITLSHFLASVVWNFSLLGIGLGFLLLTIVSLFSWAQFYLLLTGRIDPHLAKEDFFKVLETVLNSLFRSIVPISR